MPDVAYGIHIHDDIKTIQTGVPVTVIIEDPVETDQEPAVSPDFDPFEETDESDDFIQGPQIQIAIPAKPTETAPSRTETKENTLPPENTPPSSPQQITEQSPKSDASEVPINNIEPHTTIAQTGQTAYQSDTILQPANSNDEVKGSPTPSMDTKAADATGKATSSSHKTTPDEDETWQEYTKTLSAHFKKYKFYPELARRLRLTGRVVLAVEIRHDGTVTDVQIEQPSGASILDQAAVQSAKRASPAPPFPQSVSAETKRIMIPYRYQLKEI